MVNALECLVKRNDAMMTKLDYLTRQVDDYLLTCHSPLLGTPQTSETSFSVHTPITNATTVDLMVKPLNIRTLKETQMNFQSTPRTLRHLMKF